MIETDKSATTSAFVRGIPVDVLARVRKAAIKGGVSPGKRNKKKGPIVWWALIEIFKQLTPAGNFKKIGRRNRAGKSC